MISVVTNALGAYRRIGAAMSATSLKVTPGIGGYDNSVHGKLLTIWAWGWVVASLGSASTQAGEGANIISYVCLPRVRVFEIVEPLDRQTIDLDRN
jgi:hypothetical protein